MGRGPSVKKNRSSLNKSRSAQRKSRKARKIPIDNSLIRQHWDKTQTLAQNYARLGLTSKLGKRSGGVEKILSTSTAEPDGSHRAELVREANVRSALARKGKLLPGEARVERNPDGSISRIVQPARARSLSSSPEPESGSRHHGSRRTDNEDTRTDVVRELEALAARPEAKRHRWLSDRERDWIVRMRKTYGDDVGKMTRDPKRNVFQLTEGKIRKLLERLDKEEEREAAE
jgi:nucleolar protein 16